MHPFTFTYILIVQFLNFFNALIANGNYSSVKNKYLYYHIINTKTKLVFKLKTPSQHNNPCQ